MICLIRTAQLTFLTGVKKQLVVLFIIFEIIKKRPVLAVFRLYSDIVVYSGMLLDLLCLAAIRPVIVDHILPNIARYFPEVGFARRGLSPGYKCLAGTVLPSPFLAGKLFSSPINFQNRESVHRACLPSTELLRSSLLDLSVFGILVFLPALQQLQMPCFRS